MESSSSRASHILWRRRRESRILICWLRDRRVQLFNGLVISVALDRCSGSHDSWIRRKFSWCDEALKPRLIQFGT